MKMNELRSIVDAVSYKPGWSIILDYERNKSVRPYIQVSVEDYTEAALCPFSGERVAWRGGKRYLSYHMCRQEVVGACLGALKDAEMHEIHEWFKYKGVSIYNLHIDPDALVDVARFKKNLNVRENAMTMEE